MEKLPKKTMIIVQLVLMVIACSAITYPIYNKDLTPEIKVIIHDQFGVHANVSRGTSAIIKLNGTLDYHFNYKHNEYFNTLASLECSGISWEWEIKPETVLFSKNNEKINFTLTLSVPPSGNAEIGDDFRVKAEATSLPMPQSISFYSNWVHVNSSRYMNYTLISQEKSYFGEPGENYYINLKVTNNGNYKSNFLLELKNETELEERGWQVDFDNLVQELPPNRRKWTRVEIRTPVELREGTDEEMVYLLFVLSSEEEGQEEIEVQVEFNLVEEIPLSENIIIPFKYDPSKQVKISQDKSLRLSQYFKFGPYLLVAVILTLFSFWLFNSIQIKRKKTGKET